MTPQFTRYCNEYGYEPDTDFNYLNQLFINGKTIKNINIDLYSESDSEHHSLLMRNTIDTPVMGRFKYTNGSKGYLICRPDKYKTVIADIPDTMIHEGIFKKYDDRMTVYVLKLTNGYYYSFSFERK